MFDCTGQREGELRPTPLSFGGSLEIDLAAGEKVTCRWYNVPEDDPDYGRMTVIKYACTTEEFESEIDCEIEEDGVTIDLTWWNGDDWETMSSRETDGAGRATWTELEPGQYWLDEQDGSFCYLASDHLSDDGNWLDVEAGEETVVHVYNCGAEPGGEPGKVPDADEVPEHGRAPGERPGPDDAVSEEREKRREKRDREKMSWRSSGIATIASGSTVPTWSQPPADRSSGIATYPPWGFRRSASEGVGPSVCRSGPTVGRSRKRRALPGRLPPGCTR